MVTIVKGKTIFESDAQTLVNTINCVGVMGKGLALEFKNRYPEMFNKYKSYCDKGIFKPGVLWIYKAEDGKWILNFPTKIDWKNPSEYEYIEEGLKKFVEIWKDKEIKSIAFPLLGCTNGGLDADIVIPLMEKYLNQCDGCDIKIYDDREPKIEEKPEVSSTNEFFGDENPKEIVEEAKPLSEDAPVETMKLGGINNAIKQDEAINGYKKDEDQNPPALLGEELKATTISFDNTDIKVAKVIPDPNKLERKLSEEEQLLKNIVNAKKEIEKEIDDTLNEFVGQENTPELRQEVTKKIINAVNRKGFPMWSVFQI
jgi:O-acetyl-ADP-ribose deacetylase (regulator of RNase III)